MCALFRKVSLHSSTDRGLLRFCFYSVVQWFVSSLHAFLQRTVKISLPFAHIQARHGALPRTHSQRPDRRRLLYKTHREAIKSSTKETNTIFFFSFFFSLSLFRPSPVPPARHVTSRVPPFPQGHNFDTQRRCGKSSHRDVQLHIIFSTLDGSPFLLARLVNFFFFFCLIPPPRRRRLT